MGERATLGGELLHPTDYLAAVEMKGRDASLTIAWVQREELVMEGGKKETKPVLGFRETKKKVILNRTNEKTIIKLYGNRAEDWAGKRITLFPTTTKCGKETVDCIRIRPVVPPPKGQAATAPAPSAAPQPAPDPAPPVPLSPEELVGRRVKCQHGTGEVTRLDLDGTIIVEVGGTEYGCDYEDVKPLDT